MVQIQQLSPNFLSYPLNRHSQKLGEGRASNKFDIHCIPGKADMLKKMTWKSSLLLEPLPCNSIGRRFMAEILQIQRKTIFNQ